MRTQKRDPHLLCHFDYAVFWEVKKVTKELVSRKQSNTPNSILQSCQQKIDPVKWGLAAYETLGP